MRTVFTVTTAALFLIAIQAAPLHAQGTPITYKLPEGVKVDESTKKWLDRSFTNRFDLGNGRCHFGNLDTKGVVSNVRGPCAADAGLVQRMQAGQATFGPFTATSHYSGAPTGDGTFSIACRKDTQRFANGPWKDVAMVCRIHQKMVVNGADVAAANDYGFYLIDIEKNGRYVPMNALHYNWYRVSALDYRPPGL